jgi:hypothetical protein
MSVEQWQYQPPQPVNGMLPAPQQQQAPALPSVVAQMSDWAQGARAIYQVCEQIQDTSFVPAVYRNKPHEMTAAILAGMEVGLSQMASLQAFNPIQGTAAPKAITLRAIVTSQGHEMWIEEESDTKVVMAGRRRGSRQIQRSTWTIQRAKDAKYYEKNPNYRTQPKNMLISRSTSELARLIAPDAILGIPYSFEELVDEGGPVQATAEQVAPAAKTARRKTAPTVKAPANTSPPVMEEAPVSGPPLPGEDEEPDPTTTQVEHLSHGVDVDGSWVGEEPPELIDPKGPQMKRLHALLRQAEITDRDAALDLMSGVVGRSVLSSSELTRVEASAVIDRLADDGERPV